MRNNLIGALSQKRMRADAASLDFGMLARGAAAAARVCGAGGGCAWKTHGRADAVKPQ